MSWLALSQLETVASEWSLAEHLAATQVELLDDIRRILVMANSDPKKGKPKLGDPIRFDRPGTVEETKKPVTSIEDLMRSMGG